jgi:hypothetical protein
MESSQVVIHGLIDPNGVLKLEQPINLPPGEVQVTIQVLEHASRLGNSIWDVMDRSWADHRASGFIPRTKEDIDAERKAFSDEVEEGFSHIEGIQKDCE